MPRGRSNLAQPDQASSGRATSDSSVVAGLGNTNSFQCFAKIPKSVSSTKL